jgi:hypothetical protein
MKNKQTMKRTNTLKYSFENMDDYIGRLKSEDKRNMVLTRNFIWLMWILAGAYACLTISIILYGNNLYRQIGLSLYVLAFILFALIFRYLKKEYQRVDYGLPTLEMLKEAAKRYTLFQRKTLLVITPVLLVDAGMVLLLTSDKGSVSLLNAIITSQALFIPSLGLGLFFGIRIWRKRQKPLRDAALEMINELEK